MSFQNTLLEMNLMVVELKDVLKNDKIYLAHTSDKRKSETLLQHLELTIGYYNKLKHSKGLDAVIERSLNSIRINKNEVSNGGLSEEAKEILLELFEGAIYYHDIGKINPAFQKLKMKNTNFRRVRVSDDLTHSLLSSLLYIDIFYDSTEDKCLDKIERQTLQVLLLSFSYSISRHHGYLKDLSEYISKLRGLSNAVRNEEIEIFDYNHFDRLLSRRILFEEGVFLEFDKTVKKYMALPEPFYILNKLLYGLIVTCDFYATSDYMNRKIEDFGDIYNVEEYSKKFDDDKIIKNIRKYEKYVNESLNKSPFDESSINELRSDMFLEAEKTLVENIDKQIFYLEAPTGSGKTINSLNLGLNLIKYDKSLKKIFYVFPFNTLCDQTFDVIQSFFGKQKVSIINSLTPIKFQDENDIDYDKSYLDRLFLHYPMILTSHVNFFDYLFGNGREKQLPLVHLINSVVILDEIQSYRIEIWKELANMIVSFSNIFNIKFIIMSATLPRISLLSKNNLNEINLFKDSSKYFNATLFKNRVKFDFSLLQYGKISLSDLADFLVKYWENKRGRILIEFIKKATAREFYNILKAKVDNKLLYELSGDDSSLYRKYLIDKLKKKEEQKKGYLLRDVILVATQVIEAGVDIDMDVGFKDISIIEAEEQFAGRINRSCTKEGCKLFFFQHDDEKGVYKSDFRTEYSILQEKYKEVFKNKSFEDYYLDLMKEIERKKTEYNENSYEIFSNNVKGLMYFQIAKDMKMIKEKTYSVYLAHNLKHPQKDEFIDGHQVWKAFKEILFDGDMPYSKKQIELSVIKEKMNYFIYQVSSPMPFSDDESIEDITYVEEAKRFFENGKFNREAFNKEMFPSKGVDIFI
jgi:CRISPR-associated endonuclease/helicase Cas3